MHHDDALYTLVWKTRLLLRAIERAVEQSLVGTGLTVRMRAVLEVLYAHGAQTVPDIARKLEMERQYVQVMVNETLNAGLTEKRANPAHKRSSFIALTEQGGELVEVVREIEARNLEMIGQEVAAEDLLAARRVQDTLLRAFRTLGPRGDE